MRFGLRFREEGDVLSPLLRLTSLGRGRGAIVSILKQYITYTAVKERCSSRRAAERNVIVFGENQKT